MSREAMQIALDALEANLGSWAAKTKAVEVLRQALVDADDTSQERVDEMVKTEHDRAVELGKAYERGWNAALAQREWVPEALRLADALDAEFVQGRISNHNGRKAAVELRRLHEALETEQEPVAWLKTWSDGSLSVLKTKSHAFADHELEPLYTAPPKREWVGLTDEEIVAATNAVHGFGAIKQKDMNFAKAIEAKLKEKNI